MHCIEKEQGTDDDEGDGETSKILDTVREGYWDFLHYLTANFHFTLHSLRQVIEMECANGHKLRAGKRKVGSWKAK